MALKLVLDNLKVQTLSYDHRDLCMTLHFNLLKYHCQVPRSFYSAFGILHRNWFKPNWFKLADNTAFGSIRDNKFQELIFRIYDIIWKIIS
ncbi:unnamed protein product [Blepharisma stoltei]|uniref:Uncharacterized protein n=1 Tax=Blepharisma stoltei TaxID=1481888 RepID=A0AAU9I8F5_9CILI|nr:unnamed protein product [Blepharisma stoltei]